MASPRSSTTTPNPRRFTSAALASPAGPDPTTTTSTAPIVDDRTLAPTRARAPKTLGGSPLGYDRPRGERRLPGRQLSGLAGDGGGLGPRAQLDVGGVAAGVREHAGGVGP